MCLAGNQVECSRSRGAERGCKGVVAHREILCVVPQASNGVPVIIVHDDGLIGATAATGVLDELVHKAVIECQLLRQVAVILVTCESLRAVKPGWIVQVGVVIK